MHRFGTLLKRARAARGWTLEDVARKLRTHKGYVSGIENANVNPPSSALVIKIAGLYDLNPTELLLLSVAEKAPKEARGELRRRLFGAGRRLGKKQQAATVRLKVKRVEGKLRRIQMMCQELLREIGALG